MQKNVLCLALWLACGLSTAQAAMRSWTDSNGRTLEAEFAGMQGDSVLLRLSPNQTVPYPFVRLSEEDQAFVREEMNRTGGSVPSPQSTPARLPLEQRSWPKTVAVPSSSLEIQMVKENALERQYVYQSEAFEFTSQAKLAGSVMKEVARTFEATRALVNALPWGIVCKPPEGMPRFKAALYETRQDYIEAGGPENSGGVYSGGDKTFKIPFASLGLVKRGQTYFKDDGYSNSTLVHEITHQLMDEYLRFLPTWIIEGTAEYTEMLPYKAGIFRADSHKTSIKDEIVSWEKNQGFQADLGSVESHINMTRDQWDNLAQTPQQMRILYHRSLLLVYFFSHLDGDKRGTRFLRYLDAVHGEVAAVRAFFADPRVKRLEGGRFSYPRDMKPPSFGGGEEVRKHLRLLTEERPWPKLAAEIVEAYKTIGVKVKAE